MPQLLTLKRLLRDRRGAVVLLFGLLAMPFIIAAGLGIDLGRISAARTQVQAIADQAALAGASAYVDAGSNAAAGTVAAKYITAGVASLPGWITVTGQSVSTASGTTNFSGTSYNVSVSISITVQTAVLWFIASTESYNLQATGSNPFVTPVFSTGPFGASASDWNSAFAYMVPLANGSPQYATLPTVSSMYEIGSNDSDFPAPSSQADLVGSATQPIGFALRNVTGGRLAYGYNGCVPRSNAYGVITGPGHGISGSGVDNWFYSPLMALGEPPTYNANYTYSYTYLAAANGACTKSTTKTVTTSYQRSTDCSLEIERVADPANPPSAAPISGTCFSPTDSRSGYQYAAMTCGQFSGNTYAVWWNDEGGKYGDDYDYNDAYFTVTCKIAGGGSGTGNTQVVLTQ